MKSDIYFPGSQLEGVIIEFYTPHEFYCSFIEENEYIKLSEAEDCCDAPERSDVVKSKKFMIRVGDENVLCEVTSDLKSEDVSCQVLLCNTSVKLKVNYQSLRHLNEKINNDDIVALKVNDFAPIFPLSWSKDLIDRMKEQVLYKRFIVQFKSSKFDPADGRYPVNLLDVLSGQLITDHFIEEKMAIRYGEFYDLWLDYETRRIFESKEKENRKYIISSPMFKKYPTRRHKVTSSSKSKFNVEAQPFTPNSSKHSITPLLDTSFTHDKFQTPLNGHSSHHQADTMSTTCHDHSLSAFHKNVSLASPPEESDIAFTGQRIKRGLEVVSPGTRRRVTNPLSPSASISPSVAVADSQRFLQQLRDSLGGQQGSLGDLASSSGVPVVAPKTIDVRDQDYVGDGYGVTVNAAPVAPSNSHKAYPFGGLNYTMPFGGSLFAFQPYTLQNMFMYQSSLMRPKSGAESLLPGSASIGAPNQEVMSPGNDASKVTDNHL